MNYTFYDTETTGLKTRFDYPLTFAAQTYNSDFELIDEISLQSCLRPGVIPSPYAIGTNKLKISDLKGSNLSFFEMMRQVNQYFTKHSPSYFMGHKSLSYDEEILRSGFYQNLLPTYITQVLGNERSDTLILARAATVFSPGTITVELNDKFNPKYDLESLSKMNQLLHEEAHTALSDAGACAELTKKVITTDPQFFSDFMKTSSKKKVVSFLRDNLAFCYSKQFWDRFILTSCGVTPTGELIAFDLKFSPEEYFDFSTKELKEIIRDKNSPFICIKTNQHPTMMSMTYQKYTNYEISNDVLMDRARQIAKNEVFRQSCMMAAKLSAKAFPVGSTPEEKIYSGFPETYDQNLMKLFHESSWNERVEISKQFEDERFKDLGERIIYEFNPNLLDVSSVKRIESIIFSRVHEIDNKPRSLHQCIQELEDYKQKNPGVLQEPLDEYEEYLRAI